MDCAMGYATDCCDMYYTVHVERKFENQKKIRKKDSLGDPVRFRPRCGVFANYDPVWKETIYKTQFFLAAPVERGQCTQARESAFVPFTVTSCALAPWSMLGPFGGCGVR